MGQSSAFLPIIAIVVLFYFLIIRPQRQRQKEQSELLSKLAPGAEIVTIGGLFGTIVSVDDDRVRIAVADGSELEFAKNAIAQLIETPAEEDVDAGDTSDADSGEHTADADV